MLASIAYRSLLDTSFEDVIMTSGNGKLISKTSPSSFLFLIDAYPSRPYLLKVRDRGL